MNAIQKLFFRGWRLGVLVISLALIAYLLYFHRLSTLLPGYNTSEIAAFHAASNWHTIAHDPVNAPYKLAVWLLTVVWHHSLLMTRVVSAGFGLLAVLLFYNLIRHWYDFRITFLTTILFATSAGFLHNAQLGNGFVLQMAVLAFVSMIMWYRRRKDRRALAGYWFVALLAVLWYIPGMLWFELFAILLMHKGFIRQLRLTPKLHLIGRAALFLVVLAPLGYAALKQPHVLLEVSGLPGNLHQLSQFGGNLLQTLLAIGIRGPGNPVLWVGHAPLLGVAGFALLIIGIYEYISEERLQRVFLWIGCTVLSIILISFGGTVSYACLVPLLYLFIAAGLDRLLEPWLRVFPRNPIARYTGIALIWVMLSFSVLYQVRSYFVAWPHMEATKQAFSLRAPE